MQIFKIFNTLFKIRCPRKITRQNNNVVFLYDRLPIIRQTFNVIFPGLTEYIHRLVYSERKV